MTASNLQVILLQYLRELDPRFHIIWELFRDLLQVLPGDVALRLRVGVGVEGAQDLHGFIVAWLDFEHFLEALRRLRKGGL